MRTRADVHPAFLSAPPEYRWHGGTLPKLWEALCARAAAAPGWQGFILPGGARVALRRQKGKRELIIYRREPHATEKGGDLFNQEVQVFAAAFDATRWTRQYSKTPQGGPLVRLTENPDLFSPLQRT